MNQPLTLQVARRLDDPALPGAVNMARDAALLELRSQPTLRFYRWLRPTLSLGYFQPAEDLPLLEFAERGYDLVRRKTGGKAILHQDELTYSICLPESGAIAGGPAAAMETLHNSLAAELRQQAGLDIQIRRQSTLISDVHGSAWCFEDSSDLDLVVDSRKLLGSAARRSNGWILFHGSLVISPPAETPGIAGLGQNPDLNGLARRLGNALGFRFDLGGWSDSEISAAERLQMEFEDPQFLHRV